MVRFVELMSLTFHVHVKMFLLEETHRSLVGEHGKGLEFGDGLGDVGILTLSRLGALPPEVPRVGPSHPAACVRLELTCSTGRKISSSQSCQWRLDKGAGRCEKERK